MFALLAVAAAVAQVEGSTVTVGAMPVVCEAAEYAARDFFSIQSHTHFALDAKSIDGQLARKFHQLGERLGKEMRDDRPDLDRFTALMRERRTIQLEINKRFCVNRSECDIEQLRAMPEAQRNAYLKRIAPPTVQELARPQVTVPPGLLPAPPAPPSPPSPQIPKQ